MTLTSAILAATLATANPTITYSLPQTVIVLDITARKEQWHAGIYSAYAKTYLGIEAVTKDSTAYSISSVSIHAETEADQTKRFTLELSNNAENIYLSLGSQGLVACSEITKHYSEKKEYRIPAPEAPHLGAKLQVGTNIKAEAKEAANRIKSLRQARYNILVGNTDASYSGDALRAAIEELNRMENELLHCFTGSYTCSEERTSIEVLPVIDQNNAATIYEAFCLNDKDGIVPAGSLEGIPHYLEISAEAVDKPKAPELPAEPETKVKKKNKANEPAKPSQYITYRIPAVCLVRLTDGDNTIAQLRLPVYQLGIEEEYPIFN